MEKLRLSTWKKTIVSAEKAREVKDSPKTLENNMTTVTKGVKFAVSTDIRFIDFIPVFWNYALFSKTTHK